MTASVVELNCPNCDAPIPMLARGRFLCVYCAATLEVYSSVEAPDVLDNGEVALFEIPFEATAEAELTMDVYGTVESVKGEGTPLKYQDLIGQLTEEAQFRKEQDEAIQRKAERIAVEVFEDTVAGKRAFTHSIWDNAVWLMVLIAFIMFWITCYVLGWTFGRFVF